jgi:hypothetical protein
MIDDLLSKRFILTQAGRIVDYLQSNPDPRRRRRAASEPASSLVVDEDIQLEADDIFEAHARLSDSITAESGSSSGQPGFDQPERGRRGVEDEIDELSFFSRDAMLSNVQSALEAYYDEVDPAAIEEYAGSRERRRAMEEGADGRTGRRLRRDRRVLDQFGPVDIGWAASLFAMGVRLFRRRYPFNRTPAQPVALPDRARLVLFGDWGTGIPRAVKVAHEVEKVLAGGIDDFDQHVIHLGDVYYSGWAREYKKRFLPHWPVSASQASRIGSWSLNANHDMYSGGHGYYKTLLADSRFAPQSKSSYFSLLHRKWRILGLDTGWEDGGLEDPQSTWVAQQCDEAATAGQRVLLLSHHPFLSARDKGSGALRSKMSEIVKQKGIHSWMWGHEHRCLLYKAHDGLKFSACLGHGGVPVFMTREPGDPLPEPASYEFRDRTGIWANFGFATVEFSDDNLVIRLVDENGNQHWPPAVI